MSIDIEVQNATRLTDIPSPQQFEQWAEAALARHDAAELTIRLVDAEESQALNARFRHLDKPTNVLSFPAELPVEVELPLLGDIVICAPMVASEAAAQGKTLESHWAHLTIHGVLHLLGYDHQEDVEAAEMESLETEILRKLNFPDPYN